ncbi:MAG: elongation factor P [Alphaproteobacteria bacterium]
MKINGNAIKIGNVIEHKGGLWRAVKTEHTQPGKGGAYLQVELKNLKDGSKLNERFRASENVERARLEQRPYQYLYGDDDKLTFMNMEDYEQVELNRTLIGEQAVYLQDGMEVQIEFHEEDALGVALPEKVTLEVTETEPVIKGQTAANSYKPAVLENGVRTNVPPFIAIGDKVIVRTENGEYAERA